ncbi:SH3 domain-containing protein [Candidatus Latescibacterota bacterium]
MIGKRRMCILAISCTTIFVTLVSAELYNRAPEVMPGTIPEMHTTAYWIKQMDKPDEIIMDIDEIMQMNDRYDNRIRSSEPFNGVAENRIPDLDYWWPGHILYMPDFHAMTPSALGDTARSRIKIQIDYLRSKDFGNLLAIKYSDDELDEFEDEMALDTLGSKIQIRDALTVRPARLRNIPTLESHHVGLLQNAKTRWDLFNVGIVRIGSPVVVFHASRSGEYVLVACETGYGWIRTEDIAFGNRRQIAEFAQPKDFVICTGDRVQFYSDKKCQYASGWFRMGDRLPGASKTKVKIPVRSSDGSLKSATAFIRPDAEVHRGWVPYTRRNVVTTAFKLLDNSYDWTGGWFGRQHEETYRDIFAVFGFKLPWHGGLFTIFGGNDMVVTPEMGTDGQYRNILKNDPFITLQSCGGHAQLFLGKYKGTPIVLDQHGYGYDLNDSTYVEVRRCCIGDVTMPTYFLTRNVTFCTLK